EHAEKPWAEEGAGRRLVLRERGADLLEPALHFSVANEHPALEDRPAPDESLEPVLARDGAARRSALPHLVHLVAAEVHHGREQLQVGDRVRLRDLVRARERLAD